MNRSSLRVYGLTCVLMIVAAWTAGATTIVLPTDEQLIDKSPLIVSGTVTSVTAIDRDGSVWTDAVVSVERTLKGATDSTITVHQLGGTSGDRITKIFGAPEFEDGERVLLFLEPSPRGGYRVMDLFVGKFGEKRALNGRRLWTRHDANEDATLLDADLRPLNVRNVQRDATGFETFVGERMAGRKGAKTYGIENPVYADAFEPVKGPGGVRSNFTLISEPNVYRWFRFDSGQNAAWYHGGTQPGYSGGGVNELQTAMAAWTNYAEAKIRYTYSGQIGVPMKGLTAPNTVNEVLFNDPLNEIAGSWNRTTGGVVGQGGFNGVSSGGNFTATFAADDAHPAGSIRAYAITEGNLTIQDAVSPQNGISSGTVAEILAHELGHTLGFGHSESSVALMYYSVVGLGPSLRDDDKVAARWLYPNGSSTPPPPQNGVPAAPTGLTASASGTAADLLWTDNATNETSQSVWLAQGGGAFSKVGDVGANVKSARISALPSGIYRVYIVANNSAGSSAQSNTATFTITAPPVAAFSMTPQTGAAVTTTFTFQDESTGSIAQRLWNFGDGSSVASGSVATHVYANAGSYTVTLTVNGTGGSSSASKTVFVSGALNAQFAFSPGTPSVNDTLQFSDQSGGAPTSWYWTFGDNSFSSQQNPSKKYANAGTYNVSLTVSRTGMASSTRTQAIVVANATPSTQPVTALFDISATTTSPGATVTFSDRSTGSPTQWQWSFGDGAGSNAQNPQHVYAAPGTYTVRLTASKFGSSSSSSRQVVVSSIVPYRTLISAAAQTPGVGGTAWRTELSLYNAGLEGANVTLVLLPSKLTRTLYLTPRQSVTYANTLLDLFGLTSGAGAVSIEADSAGSSAQLRVTSRTFTAGKVGTYGQSVPEVQPEQLVKTLYLTGLQNSAGFRTNIGFVNRAGGPVAATLTLYSRTGSTIATKDVTFGASSFQQAALWSYFPELTSSSSDAMTMRISSNVTDALNAYASVIDNITQDPIYIQAVAAPAGDEQVVPAVGRVPGANGTFWRSDVTLFNPTNSKMTVTLRFGNATRAISVDAHDTDVLADVLSVFDLTAGGGPLSVRWNGSTGPVVTSRTYTTVDAGGTYGQSVDPIPALRSKMFVPGLRNDSAFRSNLGFVNGGDDTETFTVLVLSPSGTELARNTLTLPAKGQAQYSVSSLFPNVNASSFTLSVQGDDDAQLFAYGSMVDNASGDPVFFAGQ